MPEPVRSDTNSPNTEPKKRKCGAPKENTNGVRHGLTAGKLPYRLQYIEKRINEFRRNLEAKVLQIKGEVNVVDAAAINSACKWERHGMLAQNWLRKEADTLSANERLKFSEAIAKASDQRDKNIRLLELDAEAPAPWALDVPARILDQEN